MQQAVIHCQPSLTQDLQSLGLSYTFSKQFGDKELDVVVNDVEFDSLTEDPDVLLCDYYGIDYNQVNCIEAL